MQVFCCMLTIVDIVVIFAAGSPSACIQQKTYDFNKKKWILRNFFSQLTILSKTNWQLQKQPEFVYITVFLVLVNYIILYTFQFFSRNTHCYKLELTYWISPKIFFMLWFTHFFRWLTWSLDQKSVSQLSWKHFTFVKHKFSDFLAINYFAVTFLW